METNIQANGMDEFRQQHNLCVSKYSFSLFKIYIINSIKIIIRSHKSEEKYLVDQIYISAKRL